MGGYGSTRWGSHARKLTVEECYRLRVRDFPKPTIVERCENGAPVHYDESYPSITARLLVDSVLNKLLPDRPAKTGASKKKSQLTGQAFRVTRTACNYGGWRYWLSCPDCGRRCAVLYRRPVYAGRFACRKCHDLTYISIQEARKPTGYGALAMYLTRSRVIEEKLFKIKRWRKRAYKLDAKLERLNRRLGWAWYRYATPLFAETGIPLELK